MKENGINAESDPVYQACEKDIKELMLLLNTLLIEKRHKIPRYIAKSISDLKSELESDFLPGKST